MKVVRILFLISTLTNGGAERAMSNITTHLPENVEADILLNSVSDFDFETGANIINLGMKPNVEMGLKYQLVATCKRLVKLRQLKKNNHYDACISFMDSANICNIITGNKKCKTIVSVRVSIKNDKSFSYRYIVSPLVKLLYNKADCIVAVAEGIQKELVEGFGLQEKKVKTITNGFDIAKLEQQASEKLDMAKDLENKFVYVASGRYTTQKAHWHLIRAFAEVAKVHEEAVLLILGQGEEKEYLEELIIQYGLQEKVRLIPFCTNPFPILKHSDVFVMPSMFEGYCNAICEAMICGLPCIATDFQTSAREILAPDTDYEYQLERGVEYAAYGVLTPVCSGMKYKNMEPLESAEKALAEAMLALYEDKELYEKYRALALERGTQMDINMKVQEWLALV